MSTYCVSNIYSFSFLGSFVVFAEFLQIPEITLEKEVRKEGNFLIFEFELKNIIKSLNVR